MRDTAKKDEAGIARSGEREGNPPLLGRKSVLLGMLTSGLVVANAGQPSAMAVGKVKPIAATSPTYVSKWAPATAYLRGAQVISPNNDVVSAKSAHTSSASFSADTAKWSVSCTFGQASTLPINLTHPDYGGKVDGVTDDSAAWVLAIAAANSRGCAIYLPAGTSIINRTTFLPDLTGLGASIVGDPSGESVMQFTASGGGISIGNGVDYVYATKLTDLKVLGNGVCQTPIRMRMSEEACFRNLWVVSAATACIDVVSATSLLTTQRLTLSSSPIGIRFGGATGYVSFFQSNFYLVPQVFQVVGSQIYRMVFSDGWVEACADFLTVNTGTGGCGFSQLLIKDSYFLSTIPSTRLFRVLTSNPNVDINSIRVSGCHFTLTASNVPLIDTTAVAITSDVHLCLHDLIISAPQFGGQVLVKPHSAQTWYTYYVDAQRISGIPANQWSARPAIAGGVRSAPSDLQGTGSPESQFAAFPGSTFRRLDGGVGTAFYVKETGTGSTGWVAK
jgi:hypothetical protein